MYFAHPVPRLIFPIRTSQVRDQKISVILPLYYPTLDLPIYLTFLYLTLCILVRAFHHMNLFLKLDWLFQISGLLVAEFIRIWIHFKIILNRDRWGFILTIFGLCMYFTGFLIMHYLSRYRYDDFTSNHYSRLLCQWSFDWMDPVKGLYILSCYKRVFKASFGTISIIF